MQAALAQDLYTRAPKDKMAGQSSEGKGNKDLELSTERWLQDMKSGKREFAQEAAGVLSGMKFYGNLFVEKAETIPGSAIEWPDEIVSNPAPGNVNALTTFACGSKHLLAPRSANRRL